MTAILLADRNIAIVIMDKLEYLNKLTNLIKDGSYRKLEKRNELLQILIITDINWDEIIFD